MRVGFFFNPPRAWDWKRFLRGDLGLSGTDGQVLRVADSLSRRDGFEVLLMQGHEASPHPAIRAVRVKSAAEAVRTAREESVDVLVFNNRGDDDTRAAIRACDQLQQRSIIWDQNGPEDAMADIIAASPAVARLLCVSATQCDSVRHHAVFAKTEFAYNSVDPMFFHSLEAVRDPNKVVWLGSLTLSKGFHVLAAAWPAVRAAVPSAVLTVLGSAQLYDDASTLGPLGVAAPDYELTYLAPHLGETRERCATQGVTFKGLSTPAMVRDELLSSSVGVVNPNSTNGSIETFCVSAVEIQSCGVAVVGGNAGGLRETVRAGESGILVTGEHELAAALIELLRSPARCAKMGSVGRSFVATTFAPGAMTDRWVQLFMDVVADRPAQPPPLALGRLTSASLVRETVRRGRALPVVGRHMPSLQDLRSLANTVRKVR